MKTVLALERLKYNLWKDQAHGLLSIQGTPNYHRTWSPRCGSRLMFLVRHILCCPGPWFLTHGTPKHKHCDCPPWLASCLNTTHSYSFWVPQSWHPVQISFPLQPPITAHPFPPQAEGRQKEVQIRESGAQSDAQTSVQKYSCTRRHPGPGDPEVPGIENAPK
jgi:hypothetical protein